MRNKLAIWAFAVTVALLPSIIFLVGYFHSGTGRLFKPDCTCEMVKNHECAP